MSKPANKCPFCNQRGATKSHVWPDWLGKVLPLEADQYTMIRGAIHCAKGEERRPPLVKRKQGHASSRKPRNTCATCNGGWMSQIEQAAIPVAVPLVQGESILLEPLGQRLLAALLCLITIRAEFADPATQAVPPSDRALLKTRSEPGPNWHIWVARYTGNNPDQHWYRHYGGAIGSPGEAETDDPDVANFQVTTLVIGQLCANLVSWTEPFQFGGYGYSLTRIWPPTGFAIDWRLVGRLSDNGVRSLSLALARSIPPMTTR